MAETRADGMYSIKKRYVDLNLSSNVVKPVMVKWYIETVLTIY